MFKGKILGGEYYDQERRFMVAYLKRLGSEKKQDKKRGTRKESIESRNPN